MSAKGLLCALLAISMVACCWAAAAADPVIYSKTSSINSVERSDLKEGKRQSHALPSNVSYHDHVKKMDKHRKLMDIRPFFKSFKQLAARAWPSVRRAAFRTLPIGATAASISGYALLFWSAIFLLVHGEIFGPNFSGRSLMTRDLSGLEDHDNGFDFDQFLAPEQSRTFGTSTSINSAERSDLKEGNRKSHVLPSELSYHDHAETSVKYRKLMNIRSYFNSFKRLAARARPSVRKAADRTIPIELSQSKARASGWFLFIYSLTFLIVHASVFNPAFDEKRRMDQDLAGLDDLEHGFHLEQFLSPEQSRTFATLADHVDNMLESYRRALRSDTCMERLSCEAGKITSRFGKKTQPIVNFLEPIVPSYMYKKLEAFKNGARSGKTNCSEFKCKVPFFG